MDEKLNNYLKWSSTFVIIVFAVFTSLQITPYNVWLANLSSAMWLWWSLRVREWSLVVVNSTLLMVYFVGLFI